MKPRRRLLSGSLLWQSEKVAQKKKEEVVQFEWKVEQTEASLCRVSQLKCSKIHVTSHTAHLYSTWLFCQWGTDLDTVEPNGSTNFLPSEAAIQRGCDMLMTCPQFLLQCVSDTLSCCLLIRSHQIKRLGLSLQKYFTFSAPVTYSYIYVFQQESLWCCSFSCLTVLPARKSNFPLGGEIKVKHSFPQSNQRVCAET